MRETKNVERSSDDHERILAALGAGDMEAAWRRGGGDVAVVGQFD